MVANIAETTLVVSGHKPQTTFWLHAWHIVAMQCKNFVFCYFLSSQYLPCKVSKLKSFS